MGMGVETHRWIAPAPATYHVHAPDEQPSSAKPRFSRAVKDIAFGSVAGMVSKVFEHPFDLVKVRLQTQNMDRPPMYKGALHCFQHTYQREGLRGLYRGLSMPVLGATLENACLFFVYNRLQDTIRSFHGSSISSQAPTSLDAEVERPLTMPQLAIAAAGAGAATSLVLTPVELIKCRMQVQMISREITITAQTAPAAAATAGPMLATAGGPGGASATLSAGTGEAAVTGAAGRAASVGRIPASAFKGLDGPLTILTRTIKNDGFTGLWLGQTGTLLRETGGGVAWFLAFESGSKWLLERKAKETGRTDVSKKDLSSLELVAAGALAGISYNIVLFPADSVKSTMQTEEELRAKPAPGQPRPPRTGFFKTFAKLYKSRGLKGLYAGCGVTCMRSAPSSALIFLLYNTFERWADTFEL